MQITKQTKDTGAVMGTGVALFAALVLPQLIRPSTCTAEPVLPSQYSSTNEVHSHQYDTLVQEILPKLSYGSFPKPTVFSLPSTASRRLRSAISDLSERILSLSEKEQGSLIQRLSTDAVHEDLKLLNRQLYLRSEILNQVVTSFNENLKLSGLNYEDFAREYPGGDKEISKILGGSVQRSKRANAEYHWQELKEGKGSSVAHLHDCLFNYSAYMETAPRSILLQSPKFKGELRKDFLRRATKNDVRVFSLGQPSDSRYPNNEKELFEAVINAAEKSYQSRLEAPLVLDLR